MSEFKTFRLDEARVLYSANVGIEIENDICDWSAMVGHPVSKVYYRLTPEQELTFEQACLLVGLGSRGELEEDYNDPRPNIPTPPRHALLALECHARGRESCCE